ncbi:MAG: hypothetical protein JWN72_988, partial [Thermoleophilia bacterium]|nr:hypothetical protein [Thermoleophilia bacterium]
MTCVVVAAIWSSNPDVGNGAGSTSVVSVTVLPAISLSNQCGQRPAWAIGSVVAGSSALTATGASVCRFTFSSSNSSAMLQIYQPDRTGNAMVGIPTGWDWKLNGDGQQDISHAGTGMIILQDQWDVTGAFQRSMDGGATWQSFAPGGGTTRYTAVVSTTVGWRAGDGLVRVSSNLNANPPTWTNVGNAPATIAGIDAVDATTAWAINGPNARYTANAGATAWSSRSLGACGYAEEIDAVSSTTAFVAGNGAVCRSINSNGSAWTLLSSGGAASAYANDVMASPGTPATVWFAADGGRVFRSTNSGTLWAEVTPVPANVNLESIDVVSATEAWVGGLDGLVFHTIDSGVSWARAYVPFTAPVDNLAAPGGTSLVMSADGGPEMHTANGTSWNSYTGTLNDLRDVDSIDDQTMIASDSDGNVLYTSDSATTWVRK